MHCFQGHYGLAILGPDISSGALCADVHNDAHYAGVSAMADQKWKTGSSRKIDQVSFLVRRN